MVVCPTVVVYNRRHIFPGCQGLTILLKFTEQNFVLQLNLYELLVVACVKTKLHTLLQQNFHGKSEKKKKEYILHTWKISYLQSPSICFLILDNHQLWGGAGRLERVDLALSLPGQFFHMR